MSVDFGSTARNLFDKVGIGVSHKDPRKKEASKLPVHSYRGMFVKCTPIVACVREGLNTPDENVLRTCHAKYLPSSGACIGLYSYERFSHGLVPFSRMFVLCLRS